MVVGVILGLMLSNRASQLGDEQYREILTEAGYPENSIVAHFPPEVPEDAEDAAIFYEARQSGAFELQLFYRLDDAELARFVGAAEAAAQRELFPIDEAPDPRLPAIRTADNEGMRPLPAGSRIFLYGARGGDTDTWRIGSVWGTVVISDEQLVYFFGRRW